MTGAGNRTERVPRVTIGLPVYNGERYLAEALDSLLAQTFADFELVISDNASTDRTGEICRAYAARDPRIRYQRLDRNIGGFRNHNRLVGLARGEYFTWAAHDDLRRPEHVQRCVELLDRTPDAVLAFTRIRYIDENEADLPLISVPPDMSSRDPIARWSRALLVEAIFDAQHGVARTAALRRTRLYPLHRDADRVFLSEMALLGPFLLVDERLFHKRMHGEQSGARYRTGGEFKAWCDPGSAPQRGFPSYATLVGHCRNVFHSRLPLGVRLACLPGLARWIRENQYGLRHDLGLTAAQRLRRAERPWQMPVATRNARGGQG